MANPDIPNGLRPVRYMNGQPYTGATMRCYIPSTDSTPCYLGALVKPAGSADADGVPSVTANVSTGNAVLGVVVSVDPVTRESTTYRVASTERYVNVALGADLLFAVQDDAAATLTAAVIGNAADLTGFTSGSAFTGRSAIELSAASVTASGDNTEDVLIMGLYQTPDNAFGDNATYLVRLNQAFAVNASPGA